MFVIDSQISGQIYLNCMSFSCVQEGYFPIAEIDRFSAAVKNFSSEFSKEPSFENLTVSFIFKRLNKMFI